MDQPSIFRRNLWDEQQKRLIEFLGLALGRLAEGDPLPKGEEEITRRLATFCEAVNYELAKEGRELFNPPQWEAKDVRQYMDTAIPVNMAKKPDCQYVFYDSQASRESFRKSLTIECKRLGRSAGSPQLNQDYVKHGICRFLCATHGYGRSAPCGIMIGYVQNMDLDAVLVEVNAECVRNRISQLVLFAAGWQEGLTSHLEHSFDRAFPITPFTLRHMWADVRMHYTT